MSSPAVCGRGRGRVTGLRDAALGLLRAAPWRGAPPPPILSCDAVPTSRRPELPSPPPSRLQKWSKGKVKEKLANLVLFDKATYDKMLADVPKQKLITPSIISEKLKVNGSLARKAVKELVSKGLIRAPTPASAPAPTPNTSAPLFPPSKRPGNSRSRTRLRWRPSRGASRPAWAV